MGNNQQWKIIILAAILVMVLAACGGDNNKNGDSGDADTGAPPAGDATYAGTPNAGDTGDAVQFQPVGPDLGAPAAGLEIAVPGGNLGSGLPGCSDPNSEECPAPVDLLAGGEYAPLAVEDVQMRYPARYFDAATSDGATGSAPSEDVLIELTPSDNNKYDERVMFQVYFAESVEAALADLSDPEIAAWSTESLSGGTIGVTHQDDTDPPTSLTIGAFPLVDGRVIVLRAETTGAYAWDLWALLYEQLLDSLVVAGVG